MITSSRLVVTMLVWRNKPPKNGASDKIGRPLRSSCCSCFISPPMATIWPSRRRTIESVSLIWLAANGSLNEPSEPRSMFFCFSLTLLIDGWMCSITLPASSICGVTSSAMPEKNGCKVTDGVETELVAVDEVLVDMPVTYSSSLPTLSTAFWLLRVAMRGLDRTCTLPWVCKKFSSAAKFAAWKARP